MREIPLTKGKVAMVDDSDYEFLNQWKWYANEIKGIWYAFRGVRLPKTGFRQYGKVVQVAMHRQLIGTNGRWDIIDHKDGNGLNNQKSNLRICTNSENLRNSKKHRLHAA